MATRCNWWYHHGRSTAGLLLVVTGLILSGCDKVQIPQFGGQQPAPPAPTVSNGTPSNTAQAVPANTAAPPAQAVAPQANPEQQVSAFMEKAKRFSELRDGDIAEITKLPSGLDAVKELKLYGADITDKGVALLPKFPSLVKIDLANTNVTNDGVKFIQEMPNLESLGLGFTSIDDRAMEVIASHPRLKELILTKTNITDVGINELDKLETLEVLDISFTPVTGFCFKKSKGNRKLRVLNADHSGFKNEALQFLVGCPLEELNLEQTGLVDVGMIQISKMSKLKKLDIDFNGVTDFGVKSMVVMKDLESISLRDNKGISGFIFNKLVRCKNLRSINAVGTAIQPAEVVKLKKMLPFCQVAL